MPRHFLLVALEILAGALLGLAFGVSVLRASGTVAGARRTALTVYAAGLVAAALIYVGFAGFNRAAPSRLALELGGLALFSAAAITFRRRAHRGGGAKLLALAWAAHAAWDALPRGEPGGAAGAGLYVPAWYGAVCAGFDLALGLFIATRFRAKEKIMTTHEQDSDEAARERAERGGEGDVESAGETTAAAAIKGPDDARPVGAGTQVKVEGDSVAGGDSDPPRH